MFSDGFTYGVVAPVIPFLLQDENLWIRNDRMFLLNFQYT